MALACEEDSTFHFIRASAAFGVPLVYPFRGPNCIALRVRLAHSGHWQRAGDDRWRSGAARSACGEADAWFRRRRDDREVRATVKKQSPGEYPPGLRTPCNDRYRVRPRYSSFAHPAASGCPRTARHVVQTSASAARCPDKWSTPSRAPRRGGPGRCTSRARRRATARR